MAKSKKPKKPKMPKGSSPAVVARFEDSMKAYKQRLKAWAQGKKDAEAAKLKKRKLAEELRGL